MLSRQLLRRDIDLRSIVEEFGKLIYEEIDYLQEARNAQRFADLYGNNPTVYVPRIYWRYSKSKLLVMEWIDGERLTSPLLPEDVKTKLVSAMVQCSLQQILEKGFFHADPHGGNLLATADGKLVYLDFGMMSEVEGYQRYGILEAVIHLVNRDFRSLGQLYVRLGFIPPGSASPPTFLSLPSSPCHPSLEAPPVTVPLLAMVCVSLAPVGGHCVGAPCARELVEHARLQACLLPCLAENVHGHCLPAGTRGTRPPRRRPFAPRIGARRSGRRCWGHVERGGGGPSVQGGMLGPAPAAWALVGPGRGVGSWATAMCQDAQGVWWGRNGPGAN